MSKMGVNSVYSLKLTYLFIKAMFSKWSKFEAESPPVLLINP